MQSKVDALTVAGFVVVHGVRESDRVNPRPPPSRLPLVQGCHADVFGRTDGRTDGRTIGRWPWGRP
jgi:hypothetical protein